MAVADLGLLGSGSATSAGTTLTITNTTGATIAAGVLIHISGTWDNINTATAPTITAGAVPPAGGVTPTSNHIASGAVGQGQSATAGSGVWHICFRVLTTSTISSGATIVVLTSNQSAVKRTGHARGFTGVTDTLRGTVATGVHATGSPSVATAGTALVAGDLVIGSVSNENSAQMTGDTDTLNGSWSAIVGLATSGGAANTNVNSGSQSKIVTATGAQTYNPTGGVLDTVACVYSLVPVPEPVLTQAAYRFYADGSESGSTARAAQDTATTVDLTAGDVNLGLRVRVQESGTGPAQAGDDWQLQWEKNASGTWNNPGGTETAPDSVVVASCTGAYGTSVASRTAVGQSFKGNGRNLTSAVFWLSKVGTGAATTFTAHLYAHTGTYGSGGMATGSPLATSTNTVAVASLNTSNPPNTKYTFTFDGTFTLSDDTPYVIMATANATGDASNSVNVGYVAAGSAPGNGSLVDAGVFGTTPIDIAAEVYTPGGSVLPYASASLTDQGATTSRLTGGTGTFQAGRVSEDGLVNDVGFSTSNHTELLYALTVKQADLAHGDTLRFRVLRNGATTGITYTQVPTANVVTAAVTQSAYRFYADGTETGATALAAENTAPTVDLSSGDANLALRVRLQETNGAAVSSTDDWRLQWEKNTSGTWTDVATDTVVGFDSASLTDGASTNSRLSTGGTGAFVAGKVSELGAVFNFGWNASNHTEHLYSLTLKAADLADADTLRFRVFRNGPDVTMTYGQVPTVNVTEAGGTTVNATVALVGASTLTVSSVSERLATVALVAASTLTTTGVPVREATVALTATSTLTATGVVIGTQVATVALTAASTLTTAGVREQAATVALTATSTLTATGTVTGAATELEVVGTSKYEPTGAVSTVVLSVPGATALGDLIIAETQFNSATPMSLPSGWNEWHAISQTALGVYAFWRIATASEPADYTLTLPSTVRASGNLIVIRNADITTPEDVTSAHATANTTAQVAYPAITPITAGAWVLAIGAHVTASGETTSVWSASNMTTDIYATSKAGAATNFTGAIAHAAWTSGAFTPNLTSTLTTGRSTSISSVIRPVGAPPPTTVDATADLSASATLTTNATLFHFANSQRNSSFEAGRSDWDTFGPAAIAFPTDTGQEITGHYVARLTATSAGVPHMRSIGVNRIPLGAPEYGQYLTVYGEFQWENGTPSDCRLDVQFMDPDGTTVVQTNTGSPFTPTIGSWTRIKNNDNLIPSGCAAARLRFVIVDAVAADSILVEDIYAFVGPDIPAGPAPAWAPHPSDIWEQPGSVPLTAVSTLTADGTVTSGTVQSATVALTAVSTLSATAVREPQAAVSLTSTSTLTVTGTAFHVLVATVALTGTSTLTANAVREPQAAASLTATSTLTATAVRTQPATAALVGVSTLTATGFEQAISAVALVGVSTLSVTATVLGVQAATVALTAASTLTVTGVRDQAASAALTAASTLTVNAVRVPQASVSLTATSTLTATAIRSAVATVALTGASTLTATAIRQPQASVSLVAASTLSATALRTVLPTVALTGVSTLTATGVIIGVQSATVALTATSALTATAVREPQAAVSLVAASTLTVTAIVDHFVNGQRNSSFEAGRTDWDTFGPAAITFPNDTGLALHGTHVGRLRATSTGTPMMRSTGVNRIPVAGGAGLYLNVYANFRWEAGTIKDCRMDVQFLEIDGSTVVQTNIGTLFTPSASAWTRILNNDNLIPVGAHEVRIRFVIPSAETNDALLIEDIYSHLGSNIHNDGPHPAWAPHPEDYWDQPAVVALTAVSSLTANAVRQPQATVALVAASTLTVTAVRFGVHLATVPLTATSALTANAVRVPQASVSLVATSTLTTNAVRVVPATAALTGVSTLTATGFEVAIGAVPLVAASTLTVNATIIGQVAATVALTASSTLTATGFRTPQASVSLVAGSTLSVTAIRSAVPTVPLSAVGTLSVTAVRVPQASVSLTAASTLTVTAVRVQPATVALSAASTLTATAVRVRPATVGLSAESTLTATATVSGANVVVAAAALTAVSALTATAVRVPQAAVSFTATSTLTVTGVKTRFATVALTATSTLTVSSVSERPAAVPLTATSTLVAVAAAAAPVLAVVALSATATLSVTALRTPLASVSLVASFTLTATAVKTRPATVTLTATSTLTVLAYEEALGAVILVGASTLTAIGTITGLVTDRDLIVGPAHPPVLVGGPARPPVLVGAGASPPLVTADGSIRRYRSSTPRPPRYTGGVP